MRGLAACFVAMVGLAGATAEAAPAEYELDPARSELLVLVFKAGVASGLAHDHVVRAETVAGTIHFDPESPADSRLEIEVAAATLVIDEPQLRARLGIQGELDAKDRSKVQRTMLSDEQLDAARFPTLEFVSTRLIAGPEAGSYRVEGDLTLHGVTRRVALAARAEVDGAVLSATGRLRLLQSDYGIEPYRALLGAIRNQDEVELRIELSARRRPAAPAAEAPPPP